MMWDQRDRLEIGEVYRSKPLRVNPRVVQPGTRWRAVGKRLIEDTYGLTPDAVDASLDDNARLNVSATVTLPATISFVQSALSFEFKF